MDRQYLRRHPILNHQALRLRSKVLGYLLILHLGNLHHFKTALGSIMLPAECTGDPTQRSCDIHQWTSWTVSKLAPAVIPVTTLFSLKSTKHAMPLPTLRRSYILRSFAWQSSRTCPPCLQLGHKLPKSIRRTLHLPRYQPRRHLCPRRSPLQLNRRLLKECRLRL